MRMVAAIDPMGLQHRRNRRLKRQTYCCKVRIICISMPYNLYEACLFHFRVPMKCGTWMAMTSGFALHGCIDG